MDSQFAKPRARRLVKTLFEPREKCDYVDSRSFAIFDEIDDVHSSIAPLQLADEYLPVSDAIGELCLRHARSLPSLA
jgi:hypothetical protein